MTMKKLVEVPKTVEKIVEKVTEMSRELKSEEGEGLESLFGEQVILFCLKYHYAGKLIGINETCCLLENGGIVYETGPFGDLKWKDFQQMAAKLYVRLDTIESFAKGK